MAEMKARHAFGNLADVQNALNSGKIDAYDILFLDGDTEPKIGWIDKNGAFRLVENEADFSELEAVIATKANVSDVEALGAEIAKKVGVEEIEALESKVDTKVDVEAVQTMIEEHSESIIKVVEF